MYRYIRSDQDLEPAEDYCYVVWADDIENPKYPNHHYFWMRRGVGMWCTEKGANKFTKEEAEKLCNRHGYHHWVMKKVGEEVTSARTLPLKGRQDPDYDIKTADYIKECLIKNCGHDIEDVKVTGQDGVYSVEYKSHLYDILQNLATFKYTGIEVDYVKRTQWLSDCDQPTLRISEFESILINRIRRYMNQDDFDKMDYENLRMNISCDYKTGNRSVSIITDSNERDISINRGQDVGKVVAAIIDEMYRVLYN